MSTVFINPGSGDARRYGTSNVRQARENIRALVDDIGLPGVTIKDGRPFKDDDGRYSFVLSRPPRKGRKRPRRVVVDMPGIPRCDVQYVKEAADNIWHFPRLYVDGSSWVWPYAVDMAREGLSR